MNCETRRSDCISVHSDLLNSVKNFQLIHKTLRCSLHVRSELLSQVKEFEHLGVLFTSEAQMEREVGGQIDAAMLVDMLTLDL